MEYVNPQPARRTELARALSEGDTAGIAQALVGLVWHDPDWKWLQEQCVSRLDHPDDDIRGLAITSLGHIARIHGKIDRATVEGHLRPLLNDPDLAGRVHDALDDIDTFTTTDE